MNVYGLVYGGEGVANVYGGVYAGAPAPATTAENIYGGGVTAYPGGGIDDGTALAFAGVVGGAVDETVYGGGVAAGHGGAVSDGAGVVFVRLPVGAPASGAGAEPIGYVTLAGYAFADPDTNLRGWATGSIFPGYTDAADLATRRATWLDGITAYYRDVVIPIAAAAGIGAVIVHDGYNGQQYPHPISYNGDPSFYVPEAPQASVQAAVDQLLAAGLAAGTIIRPTIFDDTGVASGAYGQPYGPDAVQTVRDKIAAWYALGGRWVYLDSSVKDETLTLFTPEDVAGWAAEFPGVRIIFEWYNPLFAPLAGMTALHQPNPGGYLQVGGMLETPAWDAYGHYWLDVSNDSATDADDVARLSAAYARGARAYLYCGSMLYREWTLAHADLWRAAYVAP